MKLFDFMEKKFERLKSGKKIFVVDQAVLIEIVVIPTAEVLLLTCSPVEIRQNTLKPEKKFIIS